MIRVQSADFDVGLELKKLTEGNHQIGAVTSFVGLVRDIADKDTISAMVLEHYPGMTEKYLEDIVNNAIKKYKLIDGLVMHRVGVLEPTDPIVIVATWSEHRDNAFNATRDIMESLKAEAPLWKKESTEKGFRWVEPSIDNQESSNEV